MKKIVITGGPHAGKSSLLAQLEAKGYTCFKETALKVIYNLNETLGLKEQSLWREKNPLEFQDLVTAEQIKDYNSLLSLDVKYVFFDRGLHDGLGYMRFNQILPSNSYMEILEKTIYHQIFLLDVITPFDERHETGRKLNHDAAIQVSRKIKEAYEEFGYDIISVPQLNLKDRVKFIIDKI
jgi:predicted ATPase